MNTTKKIAVVLAVMMVAVLAALAAPAAMGDVTYWANVTAGQNTVLEAISGGFGDVVSPSYDNPIDESFNLTNDGNHPAAVDATFTSNYSTTYGLVSGTNVIGGTNFKINEPSMGGQNAYNTTLLDTLTDARLNNTVPWDSTPHTYGAYLNVPAETLAGNYSGVVQLTLTNA